MVDTKHGIVKFIPFTETTKRCTKSKGMADINDSHLCFTYQGRCYQKNIYTDCVDGCKDKKVPIFLKMHKTHQTFAKI